jgi:hypothetical protein
VREIVKLRSSCRFVFAHRLPSMPFRQRMRVPAMLVYELRELDEALARARNILLPQTIYIRGWQISALAGLVCDQRLR